ncbi:MAG: lyase family protein, partial [Verrucomicrobiae bacterium]|nr:lyase family protein [Verrucomicrobiae bacterium]
MKKEKKSPARSGRFEKGPAEIVTQFSESVSFDRRLWSKDVDGSLAHAQMLFNVGLLTEKEFEEIRKGLLEIREEIASGRFKWRREMEDVHMNIEAELTQRVRAGAKLHTARSRNDQVSLDMRLWLRDEVAELCREIRALQAALVNFSDRNLHVIIPGYTHLQRAQPVPLAHHIMAYVEMLERDHGRLLDSVGR